MEPMKIELQGYVALEKVATPQGNSSHVSLPQSWRGKRVKVILLEPLPDE
jgi:putative transposon-encoded protein